MLSKYTGQPRGFGFVTFADPADADKVLEQDHVIDGRPVGVKRTEPRDDVHGMKKIFVGGIPLSLTEDELREYFSCYGDVIGHEIVRDRVSGRSRGFGFVTFDSEEAVEKIFADGQLHGLGGKQVEIKRAEPIRAGGERSRHGGGGFGRGAAGYGGRADGGYAYYGGGYTGYGNYSGGYGVGSAGLYAGYSGYGPYGYGYGYGFGGPMYGYAGAGYGGYAGTAGYGGYAGAAGYGGGGSGGDGGSKGYDNNGGGGSSRFHPYRK